MVIYFLLCLSWSNAFANEFRVTMRGDRHFIIAYDDDYSMTSYVEDRANQFAVVDPKAKKDIETILRMIKRLNQIENDFNTLPVTLERYFGGQTNLISAHFANYIRDALIAIHELQFQENKNELRKLVTEFVSKKFDFISDNPLVESISNNMLVRISNRIFGGQAYFLFLEVLRVNLKHSYPEFGKKALEVRSAVEHLFEDQGQSDLSECAKQLNSWWAR